MNGQMRTRQQQDVQGMDAWQVHAMAGIYYALRADVEQEAATVDKVRQVVRRVLEVLEDGE